MTRSAADRFWERVDTTDGFFGCWVWRASLTPKGYAWFWAGRSVLGHRFAYEAVNGLVPEGYELDHLCRVRHCVNPSHLEAVTHAENVRRGDSGRYLRERTHCPQGHPYTGDNLVVWKTGSRGCRACGRAKSLRYYHRNKRVAA